MTVWNGPAGYWVPRPTTEKAIARSLNLGLFDAAGAAGRFLPLGN